MPRLIVLGKAKVGQSGQGRLRGGGSSGLWVGKEGGIPSKGEHGRDGLLSPGEAKVVGLGEQRDAEGGVWGCHPPSRAARGPLWTGWHRWQRKPLRAEGSWVRGDWASLCPCLQTSRRVMSVPTSASRASPWAAGTCTAMISTASGSTSPTCPLETTCSR